MDEVELISRVETKIVLASNNSSLSSALDLYLCPLLLKLSSQREDSRKKVLSIFEHINKRLNPDVSLPAGKLLDLCFSSGPESSLTKTLAGSYFQKAVGFSSALPWLHKIAVNLDAVTADSAYRAALLYHVLLNGLLEWSQIEKPPILDFEDAAPSLSKRFTDLFLVDLAYRTRQVAPGLNHDDFVFQLGPNAELDEATLSSYKIAVLKFIDHIDWPSELKYLPLFVATKDRLSEVSAPATSQWRRIQANLSPQITQKLYGLAIGDNGALPVKYQLQIQILDCFSRNPQNAPQDPSQILNNSFESGDRGLFDAAIKYIRIFAANSKGSSNPSLHLATHSVQWIDKVRFFIENNGWPQAQNFSSDAISLRQRAYETIGVLQRLGGLTDLRTVSFLFESLDREATTNLTSVQEALSEILNIIATLPPQLVPELKSMLLTVMRSSGRDAAKYMAIRYAMLAFPFNDPEARVICLLGLNPENRSDVQEEARRGLHPYLFERTVATYLEVVDVKLPELVNVFRAIEDAKISTTVPQVFDKAISFLSQVLINEAFPIRYDSEWSKVTDAAPLYDQNAKKAIKDFLSRTPAASKLFDYCLAGLSTDLEAFRESSKVWQMLVKVAPISILDSMADRLSALLGLLDGRFSDVVAEGLARICPLREFEQVLAQLTPLNKGRAAAMASLLERVALNGGEVSAEAVDKLVSFAKPQRQITPLFHLACGGLLKHSDELLAFLKAQNDEKSLLTIGALRLSNPNEAELYMKTLLDIKPAQNIDTLLANGEALSICVSGWNSTSLNQESAPPVSEDPVLVHALLSDIFAASKKTDPVLRRTSCVRLLCLVQFSTSHTQSSFPEIQSHFLRFLSGSDDITQEAASRGLGIVYEQSEESVKAQLVEKLVASFTNEQSSRRALAGTISEDTELFEPGMLSTGDGSISTYKDVLNLASEVGDSTLVYKFMSLAASSKIWSSRRGVAFGLETIIAKADFDTASSARKKLVPKLFRYIFDPNTRVRESMQSIWNVLVPDRRKTIIEHLDAVIEELLKGSYAREWRVREASTRALANLVETLEWRYLEPSAVDLWQMAFRMLDDIKESVRRAGLDFTKALASVVTRRLQVESESNSRLLSTLIPFLTGPRGLQSESEDVRVFAMETLIKIAKSGSKDFRPFKLSFISDFTSLLSTIEPQAMNYLALNASNYGVDVNTIDESRMRGLSRSPIMETLESLVDRLDPEELKLYMNDLPQTIKSSVGLPSKLASARLVIAVCLRFPRDSKPTPILTACIAQLQDRNDLVAQTFAAAAGYICRLVPLSDALDYAKLLESAYFDQEADDRRRLIIAVAINNFSRHASDVFNHLAASVLPLAFVGSYDADKDVSKIFKEVWGSNTGGTGSIGLYAKEIMELASPHLTSTIWHMREAGAKSIGAAAEHLKESDEAMLNLLLSAMSGRTWPGKEHVFSALIKVALLGGKDLAIVDERIVNELQRRNVKYRLDILPFVGEYLHKYPSNEVYTAFYGACTPLHSLVGVDDDDDDDAPTEDQKLKILESAVSGYHSGFNIEPKLEGILIESLIGWKFKVAVCRHMAKLGQQNFFSQELWKRTKQVCARDLGHETVRLEWVKAAGALRDFGISDEARDAMKDESASVVLAEMKKYNFV